jgi:hypothetical protein
VFDRSQTSWTTTVLKNQPHLVYHSNHNLQAKLVEFRTDHYQFSRMMPAMLGLGEVDQDHASKIQLFSESYF